MADSLGSFAGIGSGFDYTSLIDAIIKKESAPATKAQSRIDAANAQLKALTTYRSLVSTLETSTKSLRDGSAFGAIVTTVTDAAANGKTVLSANASTGAAPGSYAVQVLGLAQAEKLSGNTFASSSAALGLSGDFTVNGKAVHVVASDTLSTLRDKINTVNAGNSPSGVSAAIITDSSSASRLVLTSVATGSAGIDLVDGAQGIVRQLGWLDATSSIKHATSAGAESDRFLSTTSSIASQLGITGTGPQTVTIGGQSVSIDLSTDSLSSLATKLSGLSGIQASVQSTTTNGVTKYYLDIRNTTSFTDAGNTLEQLGVLKGGRGSTTQIVQSAALTAGDASTPAAAGTLLTSLWNGGSASGTQVGDTLTITGTRGDGAAVNVTFAIGAGSTVQDLLDTLNGASGFGGGTKPATASIDASGRITVTSNSTGVTSLGVNIIANNQGGGRLDLGAFSTTSAGRDRQLVAGADARFTVDGVAFTRSTNSITDVIANTTVTLTAADPSITAHINIDRSNDTVRSTVQAYVDAYNKLADFIKAQQTPGKDASSNPALYGESLLRSGRTMLASAMLQSVSGAADGLTTAAMAGISVTKDGHLSLDSTKFNTMFTTRFDDLQRLFKEGGASTNPELTYLSSTAATQSGAYDVNITQAASQGSVTGAGFSGTYADDATPDTLNITDLATNFAAQVQLSNGMTTTQIVDAINSAFATAQSQVLTSSATLYSDAIGTVATGSTLLTSLYQSGGASSGVLPGDSIQYGGVRADGTSFNGTFVVGPGSSIDDVLTQIRSSLGAGSTVSFSNGKINVQSTTPGASSVSLTLTPKNEGGGSLSFGTMSVATAGRGAMSLVASAVGGQIKILSNAFGAAAGFAVSLIGGGSDGTTQLGLATGDHRGTDVMGTIGGLAATGTGQQLVGATGTAVEGLTVGYNGSTLGNIGTLTLTQGLGATLDRLLNSWMTDNTGAIASKEKTINTTVETQQKRLDSFNARLVLRRASLLKRYQIMDAVISKFNAQSKAFASVLPKDS